MAERKIEIWELFLRAQMGDLQALEDIVQRFEPLIRAEASISGVVDEDVAQEIREKFYIELKKHIQASDS